MSSQDTSPPTQGVRRVIDTEVELSNYIKEVLSERAEEAKRYRRYSYGLRLLIITFSAATTVLIQTELPRVVAAITSAIVIILASATGIFKFEERHLNVTKHFGEINTELRKLADREEPYNIEDEGERLRIFRRNYNQLVQNYQVNEAVLLVQGTEQTINTH